MNYFLLYKKCLLNIKAQVFSGVHNNCSVFILFGVNDRQVRSVKDNKFVLYYYLVLWRKKIEELKFAWKIIRERLIFETQIHIQIHIRCFQAFTIATYYLTKIHIKNLYLHSKTHNMGLKWSLYLTPFSRCGTVNPSIPTFGNINLTEAMTNLIAAWIMN